MLSPGDSARRPSSLPLILGALLVLALVGVASLRAGDGGAVPVHLTAKQAMLLRDGKTLRLVGPALHPTFELRDPAGNVVRRFPSGSTVTRTPQGGIIVLHPGSSPVLVGLYDHLVSAEKGEKLRQAQDAVEAAEAARRAREAAGALRKQAVASGTVGKGSGHGTVGGSNDPASRLTTSMPRPTDPSQKNRKGNKEQMNDLLHPSSPSLHVDRGGLTQNNGGEDVEVPEAPEREPEEPPEVESGHREPESSKEPVERHKHEHEANCTDVCSDHPGSSICQKCICSEHPDDPKCRDNALPSTNSGGSSGEFHLPAGMQHSASGGVKNPCKDCGDTRGGTKRQAPRLHVKLGDTPTGPRRDGEVKEMPAGMGPDRIRHAVGNDCQDCPSSGVSRTAGGKVGKTPSAAAGGPASSVAVIHTASASHLRPMRLSAGQHLALRSGKSLLVRGSGSAMRIGLAHGKSVHWYAAGSTLLKDSTGHLFLKLRGGKTVALGAERTMSSHAVKVHR